MGQGNYRLGSMHAGQIGKSVKRKILDSKGKEISFLVGRDGGPRRTVTGTVRAFQEHNRAQIVTIEFSDGHYRFMISPDSSSLRRHFGYSGYSVIGESGLALMLARGFNKLEHDFNHELHATNWPEKPPINGIWLN